MMDYLKRVEIEGVIIGRDDSMGALVVYAKEGMRGGTVNATLRDSGGVRANTLAEYKANIVGRKVNDDFVFAAVFPRLPTGFYRATCRYKDDEVTVFGGEVAEVDWR